MFRYFLSAIVVVLFTFACEEKEDSPGIITTVYVEEAVGGAVQVNFYNRDAIVTQETFTIVLDSPTPADPVVVYYAIEGTAELGKHISPIELEGSIDIPSGSNRAVVNYGIITENILPSDAYSISIRITRVEGKNVAINPVLSSYRNEIRILCNSSIPEGRYLESTSGEEVLISEIATNTFSISNLNFSYYDGPEYGEIPGEFVDRCGAVFLEGRVIEQKYGIAWIGKGSWDSDAGELILTVADQTFNPGYSVEMKFQYVP